MFKGNTGKHMWFWKWNDKRAQSFSKLLSELENKMIEKSHI